MGRITETVKTLLIINIVLLKSKGINADALFALWFPKHPNFRIWQLITHMFMHGGSTHIFFNMFALYMFGSHIENALGQTNFLFLYFSAGLGAAGLQILSSYYNYYPINDLITQGIDVNELHALFIEKYNLRQLYTLREPYQSIARAFNIHMVGASGAIFGVVVAFAVLYPNLPLMIMFIPVPIKAKYLVGAYVLLDLFAALTGYNIIGPANTAHWAHIGGAIVGFITIWYWKKNSFNNKRWY